MKFASLKPAGLVVLSLILLVALGACDSAGPAADGTGAVGYDVTVLVVDDGDQALEDVGVMLGESEKDTGANGAAVFEDVGEGSYELDVEKSGYTARDGDPGMVTVSEDETDFSVEMTADKTSGDDGDSGDDTDSGDSGDETDDGDGGETDDGDSGDETDDGGDSSDPGAGDYNEDGVLTAQFDSGDNKVINLGTLADGDSAIVAISPLNIDPDNSNTYDASLDVSYSDGSTSSQTAVASLDDPGSDSTESSPQAELDEEMRSLETELLAQDLKPAGDDQGEVTVQDTYEIGESRSFYNWDGKEIDSNLGKIGDRVLIYLEDGYSLDDSTLEQIADRFDNKIDSMMMENFAFQNQSEYDWDGNGKVIILIEDMDDTSDEGMIMGYFNPKDYYEMSNSNEADMFYINYQGVKEAENGSSFTMDQVFSTVAHEFQHLMYFVNKENAESDLSYPDTWINEGFSVLAEYLTGYLDYSSDIKVNNYYFPETEQTSVMAWEHNLSDYGASGLIAYFLYEKLGSGIIEDIQTSSQSASQVINDRYRDFSDLLLDWMLSNYIDEENLADYSYSGFDLANKPAIAASIDGSFTGDFSIKSTAASYFEIEGNGSEVSLEIENLNEDTGVIIYHDGEGN